MQRLVAQGPSDLIAFVPLALGFVPVESVVVIAVGCSGPHARIDLDPDELGQLEAAGLLLDAFKRHHVERVALLIFSNKEQPEAMELYAEAFRSAGLAIIGLEVRGDEYREFSKPGWHPCKLDVSCVSLQAHLDGIPSTSTTRAEIEQSIQPRGGAMASDQLAALAELRDKGLIGMALKMNRENVAEQVAFWRGILVLCEKGTGEQYDVAVLLAFAAWLKGDGALAWMALDLSPKGTHLYKYVNEFLTQGLNPRKWPGF